MKLCSVAVWIRAGPFLAQFALPVLASGAKLCFFLFFFLNLCMSCRSNLV